MKKRRVIRSHSAVPITWGSILLALLTLLSAGDACAADAQSALLAEATRGGGGWVDVRAFGAKGDGETDDTVALQSAIDAAAGGTVRLPRGTYRVSTLDLRGEVSLLGDYSSDLAGHSGTVLRSTAKQGGAVLRLVDGASTPGYHSGSHVRGIAFRSDNLGVWAIDAVSRNVVDARFERLVVATSHGLRLGTYTQSVAIDGLLSVGPLDQLLLLRGNFNSFRNIDKEASALGHTGATSEAYIRVEPQTNGTPSDGNTFESILIEQGCSSNKRLFEIVGGNSTTIRDYWAEPTWTGRRSPILSIERSARTRIEGLFQYLLPHGQSLRIRSSKETLIDVLDTTHQMSAWDDVLDVDDSLVRIGVVRSSFSSGLRLADRKRYLVGEFVSKRVQDDSAARQDYAIGVTPRTYGETSLSQNLLSNPGFEAGMYGWSWAEGRAATVSFPTSEVGAGHMLRVTHSGQGALVLRQGIQVPPAWVGSSLTLTFRARVPPGGMLAPHIEGCGFVHWDAAPAQRALGEGWHDVSLTFEPKRPGVLGVGAVAFGSVGAAFAFDDFSLNHGTTPALNAGSFTMMEVGGCTEATAPAPPDTGSWRRCSRVWNTDPVPGGPPGWVCVSTDGCTRASDWRAMAPLAR